MKLRNWYGLPDFSWNFSWYSWHRDKSSDIQLIPVWWILKKSKKRNKKKSIHELVSLSIWNRLLNFHDGLSQDIVSPIPYGIDKEGSVYMEFLEGVCWDKVLSNDYEKNWTSLLRKDVRFDFSKRLWRILRIKDIEWLAHWDFQLRHLIHNVNTRCLWVIDVENSKVMNSLVQKEHSDIRGQIDAIFWQSQRWKKCISDDIEEWYYSKIEENAVLWDLASQLEKDLWFHHEQLNRFFKC